MRHQIGESGRIIKAIPTLCCNYVIPIGCEIEIRCRTSDQAGKPREVEIYVKGDGGITIHKVKISKIWFEGEKFV